MARLSDPIRLVMSSPVVSVETTTTLRQAATVLRDEHVGLLAVVNGTALLGVLSERDITRSIADGADPDEVWVGDVMSDEPVDTAPDDPVIDGLLMMVAAGVRHLPVTVSGEVVGMLSMREAVDVLVRHTLARLSH